MNHRPTMVGHVPTPTNEQSPTFDNTSNRTGSADPSATTTSTPAATRSSSDGKRHSCTACLITGVGTCAGLAGLFLYYAFEEDSHQAAAADGDTTSSSCTSTAVPLSQPVKATGSGPLSGVMATSFHSGSAITSPVSQMASDRLSAVSMLSPTPPAMACDRPSFVTRKNIRTPSMSIPAWLHGIHPKRRIYLVVSAGWVGLGLYRLYLG